jgi:hypothetical protein
MVNRSAAPVHAFAVAALICAAVAACPSAAFAIGDATATLDRGVGNDLVVTVKNTGVDPINSVGFSPLATIYTLANPRPAASCVTPPREPGDEDLANNIICGDSGFGGNLKTLIPPGGTFTFTVAVSPRYPDGAGGGVFFSAFQDTIVETGDVAVTGPTAPIPVLGKLVAAQPLTGNVFISFPGAARASGTVFASALVAPVVPGLKGRKFSPLRLQGQIPVGSLLDTRKGTVKLTSAASAGGAPTADFSAGVFQVLQSRAAKARGLTELRLKGASFSKCTVRRGKKGSVEAEAARKSHRTIRRLRGRGKGRFRTRGRYSAATVRGTDWTVTDRCDGTLTSVRRGKVVVKDFRRHKTVTVRAGKHYLARGPK